MQDVKSMVNHRLLYACYMLYACYTPPRYEVYRGYIVFVFSVIMSVCLSVNFFSVKYFSTST